MANFTMTCNPQIITIDQHNTDRTLSFDAILMQDDFVGTVVLDNISAAIKINTEGAVDTSTSSGSGIYDADDTPFFDARRGRDLHFYGASGTTFQARILYQ